MSAPAKKIHGMQVVGIQRRRPGSSDSIEHTLHHFLAPHEGWDTLGPRTALTTTTVKAEFEKHRLGHGSFGMRVNDAIWWESPRADLVDRAHTEGYRPRYLLLIEKAGKWQVAGTMWVHDSGARYTANVQGYIVAGDLQPDSFSVRSAYRSPVISESRPQGKGLGSLGELARFVNCQPQFGEASKSAGGAVKEKP
jgi:hypothetical protein